MRDNPEGGELDPVVDARRRCKKNSFVLSCLDKRIKQGCDRGSEVGTVLRRGRASSSEENHRDSFPQNITILIRSTEFLII